ncbi:MAG: hypothetical protein ACOZF0_17455 [Thermodesulfobacteriota bacterium]
MLETAARDLGPLLPETLFLGGAATGLLLTDPAAPICRWQKQPIILDVIPTDPSILGFGNCWFAEAFASAIPDRLPSGQEIKLLPAPYFLATKMEAFLHRGSNDHILSTDMEDIIVLVLSEIRIIGYGNFH